MRASEAINQGDRDAQRHHYCRSAFARHFAGRGTGIPAGGRSVLPVGSRHAHEPHSRPIANYHDIFDPKTRELKVQLPELRLRAVLVIRAIYWAVGSGITTCLLMIVAFASAYIGARHEPAAAVLFTLSLCLFTASLISFAREVRIALNQNELASEKS
jgi:hypothetical protein